jgi:hypothetical protein
MGKGAGRGEFRRAECSQQGDVDLARQPKRLWSQRGQGSGKLGSGAGMVFGGAGAT